MGREVTAATSRAELEQLCAAADIDVNPAWVPGRLAEELLEHYVISTFTGPTFVTDYPVDTSR